MRSEGSVGSRRLRLLGLLAALALAVAAAWPLLVTPGIVNTRAGGDSPFLLQRVYELQGSLRAGVFPARWMPDAAYGLGYPFFNYYASLPYYVAAVLSLAGAGILWAIKITQLLGFLAAAAAMYALVEDLTGDGWAALLASAAYTFAPFHMANVYVRGDSLSEFYAFVFYALIVWAIVRLRRAPTVGHVALLAGSYAGLVVTHTVSAMIFSPLAGLVLLWAVLTAPKRRLAVLLTGAAAILLGLALSAWYWAPALREQFAVSLTDMTTGYFNYAGHFRGGDLIQRALLFDYRIDSKHTPFVIGGAQAALVAAGLVVVAASWLRRRRPRWGDLALLPLVAYAVWPITPSSEIAWANVPLLPMAQFPWRFLSIAALAGAIVAGVAAGRLGRWRWLSGLLAPALAVSALALLHPEALPLRDSDVTAERLQLYEQFTGNIGSTVRAEYLPAQAIPRPLTSAALIYGEAQPEPVAAQGGLEEARLVSAGPTEQTWEVTVTEPETRLVFQTYDFLGWQATVDGQPAPIEAEAANGRIALTVDEGRHEIALSFGSTPLRSLAERISLGAAAALAVLVLAGLWRTRRRWRRLVLTAGLLALTLAAAAGAGALAPAVPKTGLATETMDFLEMPYLHPTPGGVQFDGGPRLVGYEVEGEADPGDTLHLRLHWEGVEGSEGLQVVARLTTAAEPLSRAPSLVESATSLTAVTEHDLVVPPEVSPGLALLAVEVRGSNGGLAARSAQGTALGTIYLSPVRVHAPQPAPDVAAVDQLGKYLDVLQANVTEPGEGVLRVNLTWRPIMRLPEDYVTSVKLWGPDGRPVSGAALDVQPRYGLYPTSLWPVDTPVADYYELQIPPGTPPGSDYQVEVTMYQARTLEPIGRILIPNVSLSRPTIDPSAAVQQAFDCGLGLTDWKGGQGEVADGETINVRLQWKALSTPLPDAGMRLSLRSKGGEEIAASRSDICPQFPTSRWPLNALVNERLSLRVPPGTPAGTYTLQFQLVDAGGRSLGEWSPPGEVQVTESERNTTLPSFERAVGVEFGGLIRLPGYDLAMGDSDVTLTFHWQAIRAPGRSYKVFLHCYNADGEIVAQRDTMPLGDSYPTSRWAADEVVNDQLVLDMKDVPAGRYQLAVGWYDPQTGERLEPVGGSAPIDDRRVMLTEIDWPGP